MTDLCKFVIRVSEDGTVSSDLDDQETMELLMQAVETISDQLLPRIQTVKRQSICIDTSCGNKSIKRFISSPVVTSVQRFLKEE